MELVLAIIGIIGLFIVAGGVYMGYILWYAMNEVNNRVDNKEVKLRIIK